MRVRHESFDEGGEERFITEVIFDAFERRRPSAERLLTNLRVFGLSLDESALPDRIVVETYLSDNDVLRATPHLSVS